MFKYAFIFFGILFAIGVLLTISFLIVNIEQPPLLKHIVYILSSVITVVIYHKTTKNIPTRNEAMWFLLFVCLLFFIFTFGVQIYRQGGMFIFDKDIPYVNLIGGIVGAIIDMFITVYIPFVLTCKLIGRKNSAK